ncbi:MAG: T9SS type A sorting domain-containing protein [Bacteroidetes bacterium]|nr:T9SS type A sorting domain-containing protein [Bacteroidota bacterium]
MVTHRDIWFGQAVFSPQGNKFAYYEPYGDLDIWDFDRCSGAFTNQVHIDINDSAFAGGAAFSQSGRYLYISSTSYMYQFDVLSNNIDSSKTIVGIYDGYTSYTLPTVFYLSALAPDGKIYTNSGNSSTEIHVINYPDSAGLSCDFCQHCVFLPGANAFTMPNHPNYFLGAEGGTVCDSLPTGISTIRKPVNDYSIFPNPSTVDLYINLDNERIESVSVFNSLGQQVSVGGDIIKNEYLHFNVENLKNGFYYIELLTAKQKVIRTFVKQ